MAFNEFKTLVKQYYGAGHYHIRANLLFRASRYRLTPLQQAILTELNETGFAKRHLDQLDFKQCAQLNPLLERVVPFLKGLAPPVGNKPYSAHLPDQVVIDSEILLWGMQRELLQIAQCYLKTPIFFRGVYPRRDFADGREIETRLFHRDPEDFKSLKVVVYLNDVDEGKGPFECYPKPANAEIRGLKHNPKGRVYKEELEKLPQKARLESFTGPKGSVVFVDTCTLYHRGKLPTAGDRYALFFCYLSQRPAFPKACDTLFSMPDFLAKSGHRLSTEQKNCLNGFQ